MTERNAKFQKDREGASQQTFPKASSFREGERNLENSARSLMPKEEMMKELKTLVEKKSFRYKGNLTEELIIYTSDEDGKPQDKSALVITPYVIAKVKSAIRQNHEILMGASRDNPPPKSLGALLKVEGQAPQQLSYLIPILKESGFCNCTKEGRAIVVVYKAG